MPPLNSADHLAQADRFTRFVESLPPEQPYKEWVLVLWFYIALHYVEAFLVTKSSLPRTHESRRIELRKHSETRAVQADYHELYKVSREARYDGTPFRQADLDRYRPMYHRVVAEMKNALRI